jgi:predicted RNase H-like HicB family nuclease
MAVRKDPLEANRPAHSNPSDRVGVTFHRPIRSSLTSLWKPGRAMSHEHLHPVIEMHKDGFFTGDVPVLPGCHSQARSIEEPRHRMEQAIEVYLEAPPDRAPDPSFVDVQSIEV